MKNTTRCLLAGLLMTTLFAACSRPAAYFQPGQREHFTSASAPATTVTTSETSPVDVAETPALPTAPATQIAQAQTAMDQMDAMVRSDSKLVADKSVQKRLNRVRTLLASASAKTAVTPTSANAPKKSTLMERLMLKKLNKKINKQLAPSNPNKPMASTGVLAAGAVLVIVALILILTGSASTVGVILLLAGAVVLLVGLL